MSRDNYSYQNLLRERLQRDVLMFMRSDDEGPVRDMRKLIKDTGVKGIKDLSGDALMDFARDALAIIHPQEEATPRQAPAQWPSVSEGPIDPEGKGWITFDEACLPDEDRGPEYLSGIELDVVIKLLSAARAKLTEEKLLEVLYGFTGTQAFSVASLKVGQGYELGSKLILAIEATNEF